MKKKIQAPIIQYEDTDCEFLKRIAPHMNTVPLTDVQINSYNPNITGVGLIGTMLKVKEVHARIHLDIDGEQKKDEA